MLQLKIGRYKINRSLIDRVGCSKIYDNVLKMTGATRIHCLGDSHTKAFHYIANNNLWLNTSFSFCIVSGGTALGLANPQSKTQALSRFRAYLDNIRVRDSLLFCLGEVDCGYLIWYRAEKYKLSIQTQLHQSLNNYVAFLDEASKKAFGNMIVCSAPLPTILDNQDWGEVAQLRQNIKASLQQRLSLTFEYNEALRDISQQKGWHFLDIASETFDADLQMVKPIYKNPNPLDHHLNPRTTSSLIMPKLTSLGYW